MGVEAHATNERVTGRRWTVRLDPVGRGRADVRVSCSRPACAAQVLPSAAAGRTAAIAHLKAHLRAGPAPAPRCTAPVGPRSAIRTSAPPGRVSAPCPGGAGERSSWPSSRTGKGAGGRSWSAARAAQPPTPPRRSSPPLRPPRHRRGTTGSGPTPQPPQPPQSPQSTRRPSRRSARTSRTAPPPPAPPSPSRRRHPGPLPAPPPAPQGRRGSAPAREDRSAPRPPRPAARRAPGRTHRARRALPRLPGPHRTRPRDARRPPRP